jgi:hypothetical protein
MSEKRVHYMFGDIGYDFEENGSEFTFGLDKKDTFETFKNEESTSYFVTRTGLDVMDLYQLAKYKQLHFVISWTEGQEWAEILFTDHILKDILQVKYDEISLIYLDAFKRSEMLNMYIDGNHPAVSIPGYGIHYVIKHRSILDSIKTERIRDKMRIN